MQYEFLANAVIKGQLEVLTGLHIGGSKEKLQIGGVDSPVIRDPNTNYPFIPGSSLKGKMRMLLEFAEQEIDESGKPSKTGKIAKIFGTSAEDSNFGPTRLVVRDSYPTSDTIEMWKGLDSELQFTEFKPENSINRITSEANPRFLERIVKGSKFDLTLVYSIYNWGDEGKQDLENLQLVIEGLRLLEHSGLGGNISRGYGQVRFQLSDPIIVSRDNYKTGGGNYQKAEAGDQALKDLKELSIPQEI